MHPLPYDQLSLVGAAPSIHIRQPADDALSRLGILRLLLYYLDNGQFGRGNPLLLCTLETDGMGKPRSGLLALDQYDYNSRSSQNSR